MTTTTDTPLQQAAHEARSYLYFSGPEGRDPEHPERDGLRPNVWLPKKGAPDWLSDMCHGAHGDMMPDDQRYAMIVEALDALEEWDDVDEARDSLEAPIYTHELTEWLGSSGYRPCYVDEAREEFGPAPTTEGIVFDLARGWLMEAWEVFDAVHRCLEERAEESEDDDG